MDHRSHSSPLNKLITRLICREMYTALFWNSGREQTFVLLKKMYIYIYVYMIYTIYIYILYCVLPSTTFCSSWGKLQDDHPRDEYGNRQWPTQPGQRHSRRVASGTASQQRHRWDSKPPGKQRGRFAVPTCYHHVSPNNLGSGLAAFKPSLKLSKIKKVLVGGLPALSISKILGLLLDIEILAA